MGYNRNTTPFIDKIANNGLFFKEAIINGVGSYASFISLFSSSHPFMYGNYNSLKNRPTIASTLTQNKIKTAGFNDNGWLAHKFNFDKGFETYSWMDNLDTSSMFENLPIIKKNKSLTRLARYTDQALQVINKKMEGESINNRVFDWLSKNYKEKFFLWIHYMDVHSPYYSTKKSFNDIDINVPTGLETLRLNYEIFHKKNTNQIKLLNNVYDAQVRYTDDKIKEIYDLLEAFNINEKTYTIITGDHGEELYERGYHHRHTCLYDEMLHVPLIINGADLEKRIIENQVESIDIAPTILRLFNVKKHELFFGNDLINPKYKKHVISEVGINYFKIENNNVNVKTDFFDRINSIRYKHNECKWKYIINFNSTGEEIYNLTADPLELNNLIDNEDCKEIIKLLKNEIFKHIRSETKFSQSRTFTRV